MNLSTTQRLATLVIAAAAVTAIGGSVSSAGDEATTCQSWHPRIIVSDRYQHTWNPDDAIEGRYLHTWNPDDAIGGRYLHTWNPDEAIGGRYLHTWNPDEVIEGRYQHTWNPAGDPSDACVSPSPRTP